MTTDHDKALASYQRILERERKAKKLAEQQLEDYSREIYQSNVLLQEQTLQAQNQQKHLAFLISVAEDNWHSESVAELIDKYLQKSCVFLKSPSSVFFQIEKDLSLTRLQIAKNSEGLASAEKVVSSEDILHSLQAMDLSALKSDFLGRQKGALFKTQDYLLNDKVLERDFQVYLLPVFNSKGQDLEKLSCMCFFYSDYNDVDLLKLQTIEASHSIFSIAIERKKAESALKTKLKELQQSNHELQQIQQQLIESEKLASLGQLSAGVAHEINNPVGFVLSNLNTMSDYIDELKLAMQPLINLKPDTSAEEILNQWQALSEQYDTDFLMSDTEAILSSSINGLERVKDIVSDLGSFARMDTDELAEIDINEVIQSALNIVKNELKYKHTVELALTPELGIWGNDGQLQQVFINLFVNAKHAMADGGCLKVTSGKVKERVFVSVKDEGTGITPEALKEIFTPFYTTKPPGEGTGLGLSISYSILQRHHAKVKVRSELGVGTEFILSFVPAL